MSIWCESCKCLVGALCSVHHFNMDKQRGAGKGFRSTKGASKARRDQINSEIRSMRALLPIQQDDQERLSYLHSMAAICTYIRKSVLLPGHPAEQGPDCRLPYEAFLEALHGFILVSTTKGRLVYVSENVSEYLGHSMVDVLQGDTFYDMVERPDVDAVKSQLETDANPSTERSFVCCMHTSKAFRLQHGSCCSMLVRGHFQPLSRPSASSSSSSASPTEERLFVALCTPTVNRLRSADAALFSQSFTSDHRPDMTFAQSSDSVLYYLGYSAEEMTGRSWYSLVHPEDLSLSAACHKSLMGAEEGYQVEMVLRLQCKDLSWTWVYIRATKDTEGWGVSCTNHIISETEATFLMQKIHSDAFNPSTQTHSCPFAPLLPAQTQDPSLLPPAQTQSSSLLPPGQTQSSTLTRGFKRRRTFSSQSEESSTKSSRMSEEDMYYMTYASSQDGGSPLTLGDSPAFFSPSYSPAPSSPQQKEDPHSDFLLNGYTDHLGSSPESSPPYFPYPEAGPNSHHSSPGPSGHHLSVQPVTDHFFGHGAFGVTRSPDSSMSPSYDFPACAASARLVPDCLSGSDVCESPVDSPLYLEGFTFPTLPQEGSSFLVHHVPHSVSTLHPGLLTPNPSPASPDFFQYSERDQEEISILARQISSLASSFDMYHTLSPLQSTSQPSTCDWPQHSAPPPTVPPPKLDALSDGLPLKAEMLLDDGVFDSILKDLALIPGKHGNLSCPGAVSYSYQQGVPCAQLGQENSSNLSLSTLGDQLPVGQTFTQANMDTYRFTLRSGSQDHNTELHQLNHYAHSSLQQDGLVEESLY